jgi:hypothetical protein
MNDQNSQNTIDVALLNRDNFTQKMSKIKSEVKCKQNVFIMNLSSNYVLGMEVFHELFHQYSIVSIEKIEGEQTFVLIHKVF